MRIMNFRFTEAETKIISKRKRNRIGNEKRENEIERETIWSNYLRTEIVDIREAISSFLFELQKLLTEFFVFRQSDQYLGA